VKILGASGITTSLSIIGNKGGPKLGTEKGLNREQRRPKIGNKQGLISVYFSAGQKEANI